MLTGAVSSADQGLPWLSLLAAAGVAGQNGIHSLHLRECGGEFGDRLSAVYTQPDLDGAKLVGAVAVGSQRRMGIGRFNRMTSITEISIDSTYGTPVVSAPRFIDISDAHHLRAALLAAVMAGNTAVVDLSQTDLCDPRAFGEIERAHQRATANGGEVRVVLPGAGQAAALPGRIGRWCGPR